MYVNIYIYIHMCKAYIARRLGTAFVFASRCGCCMLWPVPGMDYACTHFGCWWLLFCSCLGQAMEHTTHTISQVIYVNPYDIINTSACPHDPNSELKLTLPVFILPMFPISVNASEINTCAHPHMWSQKRHVTTSTSRPQQAFAQ